MSLAENPGDRRMIYLKHLLLDILQTAFRLLPWPTKTGLREIGNPTPDSPVLVTCNYDLTVRRLVRTLQGQDVWLVVAPSSGINVWCAAAGGHFSTHRIVSALKTSGIGDRVNHRTAILPQLAATGVISKDLRKRVGWRAKFGPAYLKDIPEFLQNGLHVTDAMRKVSFSTTERIEMAATWAAPASLIASPLMALVHGSWGFLTFALTWVFAFFAFFFFERMGGNRRMVFVIGASVISALAAGIMFQTTSAVLVFAIAGPVLAAVVTADYSGSTPVEASSHIKDSAYAIALSPEKCVGVYTCIAVCPEDVFREIEGERLVAIANPSRCIRCGACIVQCPADALYFEKPNGEHIGPDIIRRYKLNLLGSRSVDKATPPTPN